MRLIQKGLMAAGSLIAMLGLGGCGDDCEPAAVYGPQPCETDQQCIDDNGAGWYCDKDNTIDNGCEESTWPMCKES